MLFLWLIPLPLEQVLQGKLHDARVARVPQLTEERAVQIRGRISRPEAVRDVVRLSPELETLAFRDAKDPGQRHVEIPLVHPSDASRAHVPECTQSRRFERRRVEQKRIGTARRIADRIASDIVCRLVARVRAVPCQIRIRTGTVRDR